MSFNLNSGDSIPLIGFGTWQLQGTELIRNTLDFALAAGYRLIDTAAIYRNEEDIGKALKELLPKYNLTRKDIFITTKLSPLEDNADNAYSALEQSLKRLDCDYVDLYLIHHPGVLGKKNTVEFNSKLRDGKWQQLVKAKKNGLTKNIGVSNYNVRHLEELLKNDHGVKPSVNQVQWHPKSHPDELLNLCKQSGVLLQAWGSLGGTGHGDLLLDDPEVKKISEKLGKTPAQVLLKWALQQNLGIIPKASSKNHIEDNMNLDFSIPEEDMNTLNNMKQTSDIWERLSVI
nr:uncharacterized protein LOC111511821 [Leptinotarsa decemlineata]